MSLDPYRDWLGLASARRPPTHYELLGVEQYEDDPDRLHQAALAQIAKLRKYQTGKHSDLTQELMNEISQARICLLDVDKKADYDLQLRLSEEQESRLRVAVPAAAWRKILVVSLAVMVSLTLIVCAWVTLSRREQLASSMTKTLQPPPSNPKLLRAKSLATKNKAIKAPPSKSTKNTSPKQIVTPKEAPKPVDNKTTKGPPADQSDKPRLPKELPRLPGLKILWETATTKNNRQPTWCQYSLRPRPKAIKAGQQRWELNLSPGEEEGLFLPAPQGDCRLAMHVVRLAINDPRQSLYWGAFESPKRLAAASLVGSTTNPITGLALHGTQPNSTSSGEPAPGKPFWLELRRIGQQWDVYQSIDGEQFARLATGTLQLQPVLCGLRMTNRATGPMQLCIDYCRIEGNDAGYAERLKSWPSQPPAPESTKLAEQFVGNLEPLPGGFSQLSYSFLTKRQVEAWGGERAAAGVVLRPGHTVTHGPLHAIRRVQFQIRFVGKPCVFELVFSAGGVIRFDGKEGAIRIGSAAKKEFAFQEGPLYVCQVELGDTATVAVDSKTILEGPCRSLQGQLSTRAVGENGENGVDIQAFVLEGRYDVLPLWMAALRGEQQAVALYKKRPTPPRPVPKTPEPAPPEVGAVILRQSKEGSAEPLALTPGEPANLRFVNTGNDENHPYLEPDGLTLHYSHSTGKRDRLEFARRSSVQEHFREVGMLTGLPTTGSQRSPSLAPDRRTMVFASNHIDADNFDLFRAFRPASERPFDRVEVITAIQSPAAETRGLLTPDGLELYFTRSEAAQSYVYVTSHDSLTASFGAPDRVIFPEGFRGGSLTADGLTMYLDRSDQQGRSAVFRTSRASKDEDLWDLPTKVHELSQGSTGRTGDMSPYVTPDGKLLYFASDRPGGAGGLDLWVVQLPEKTVERPLPPGAIDEWLILGPIPRGDRELADDICELIEEPRLPKKPPKIGDKDHGLTWRQGQINDLEAGIYLLAFTFSVRHSAEAVLTVESTPGGVYFWINGDPAYLDFAEEPSPWSETDWGTGSSGAFRLRGGGVRTCRLLAAVCVANPRIPLVVQLIDIDTSKPIEDLISKIR